MIASPGVMVSNGAFVLKEWVQGLHVLAERNRHYWNDAATHLDAVKYLHIPDENAELTRYRAGDLHVTNVVPRGQFDWIKAEHSPRELHIAPQLNTYYYGFNLRPRAVQGQPGAAARALARDRSREARARSCCESASCRHTAGFRRACTTTRRSPSTIAASRWRSASPKRASSTREAGYSAAKPLRFELRYNAGEVHDRLAVAITSMWKEALGAEVQLDGRRIQIPAAGHRSRRRRHVPLELGRATTTTRTPSRST